MFSRMPCLFFHWHTPIRWYCSCPTGRHCTQAAVICRQSASQTFENFLLDVGATSGLEVAEISNVSVIHTAMDRILGWYSQGDGLM